MSSVLEKKCFRNDAEFVHGVVIKRGPRNEPYAISLDPGRSVWMDAEEEMMTARAPREEKDSPFLNGLNLVADAEGTPADRWTPTSGRPNPNAEHIPEPEDEAAQDDEPPKDPEPKVPELTGTEPAPAGDSATGERSPDEIVATPEAEAKAPPAPSSLPPGFGQ